MSLRRLSIFAMACWLGMATASTAQVYTSADSVRSLYHRYLGREPSSNELTQWVWSFQKGLPIGEAEVTFLSSDEYFQRYGGNATAWIRALYAELLSRVPSNAELTEWGNNYNRFAGNREQLVRAFIPEAKREASERAPLPPTYRPPAAKPPAAKPPAAQPPAVPLPGGGVITDGQLVMTARLLRDALEDELGGTAQGRQLTLMGRNLVHASRSLERAQGTPTAASQAARDVRLALTALEDALRNLHFSAPNSAVYLDRYESLFESMGGTASESVPLPPATRPVAAPGIDTATFNEVLRVNTALSANTQQLLYTLRSVPNRDTYYTQLLRDVEFFYSQVDSFHHSLRVGLPLSDARTNVLRLRALAGGVSRSIQQGSPSGVMIQQWNVVAQNLRELGELVGVSTGPAIDPGQPVLFNSPTYTRLPYLVQRYVPLQVLEDIGPTIDEGVVHINAFVVSCNRFLAYSPRVPGLQAEARRLRLSLMQMRQEVTNGAQRRQVRSRLVEVNESLKSLNNGRQQAVAEASLANLPDLSEITASVQKLNQVLLLGQSYDFR